MNRIKRRTNSRSQKVGVFNSLRNKKTKKKIKPLTEVKRVEAVSKGNGRMLAMAMRRLRDNIQDGMKDNHKTEAEIVKSLGVKRYEK